ncbi:LysR family transcriptional regulator [Jatrophihabitans fulvus]
MSLDVSLRLLRAFVAVADTGHVGRAAQQLYVSQPSLSQDIRRLEKQVRVELFVRTSKGMEITPAGDALLHGVRSGLLAIDRGVTHAAAVAGIGERAARIGYTPSVGNRLMPALLAAFAEHAAAVRIDEREVDTGEVGPGVAAGRFDLGFAHCPDQHDELHLDLLLSEPACVAVAADSPVAARARVTVADLTGLGLLLWPRDTAPAYFDHLLQICRRGGYDPPVVPGPRRAMIRGYLLSTRNTFCLLPRSTSTLSVPGVTFVDCADDHATIPLHAVRRRDDRRPDIEVLRFIASAHAHQIVGGVGDNR